MEFFIGMAVALYYMFGVYVCNKKSSKEYWHTYIITWAYAPIMLLIEEWKNIRKK